MDQVLYIYVRDIVPTLPIYFYNGMIYCFWFICISTREIINNGRKKKSDIKTTHAHFFGKYIGDF